MNMVAAHGKTRWQERREAVRSGVRIDEQPRVIRPIMSAVADSGSQSEVSAQEPVWPDRCLLEDPKWGKLTLLKLIVERLTGQKVEILRPDPSADTGLRVDCPPVLEQSQFWLVYERYEAHYEAESTEFYAAGVIRTTDGHEIRFDIMLSMNREFFREESTRIRIGREPELKDPLVINFTGNAATLTTARFAFDLNGDGRASTISFVGPGSGILVLDRNGDGVVNDGTELFGPRTGDGFAELAVYDVDLNGWIDADDPVYGQLRVWTRDGQGNDLLLTLADAGVAAIYLDRINTPFSITTRENDLLGQIRSTGVYVGNDYSVGTIQQIDLVVS